jgi:two-component system sensor histidine kinase MprB
MELVVGSPEAVLRGRVAGPRVGALGEPFGLRKAAHDIRTPLATVIQGVDALLELPEDRSERARRIFDLLRRNVHWMGTVLESSAISSRQPLDQVDLVKLVEDTRSLIAPLLAAREQSVSIETAGGRMRIQGDYAGLARAILNLLDNASKYGPRGDQLRVTIRPRSAGTVVSVIDHGPGVPAGERHAIFRAFYRSPAARRSGQNGNGLGLSVVKDVVMAHGGTLGVSCARGATRVWFFLPSQPPDDRGAA